MTLFCLPPCRVEVFKRGISNENYLKRENTTIIKGLFVLLVYIRHYMSYVRLPDTTLNYLFEEINNYSDQLIVTMFFFYSGYGIYESIKSKRDPYVKNFAKKRLLPTWISFAVVISMFYAFNYITGVVYDTKTVLLSFTGWTSIGNSNWFMFVTFALYVFLYISFNLFMDKTSIKPLLFLTFLSMGMMFFLFYLKDECWWNTVPCFLFGMYYSRLKDQIEEKVNSNYWAVFILTGICFIISFFVTYKVCKIFFFIEALAFTMLVLLVTMKIEFKSSFLKFLGNHVFSIYILQRLVFLVLKQTVVFNNVYLYFVVSFVITIVASCSYDLLFNKVKNRLCSSVNK